MLLPLLLLSLRLSLRPLPCLAFFLLLLPVRLHLMRGAALKDLPFPLPLPLPLPFALPLPPLPRSPLPPPLPRSQLSRDEAQRSPSFLFDQPSSLPLLDVPDLDDQPS